MGPQQLAVIGMMALLAAGAGVMFSALPGLKLDNALDEVVMLSDRAAEAGYYLGAGGITNFGTLVTKGYVDGGRYTDGSGENEFGNDITAVSASGTGIVTLVYALDEAPQCQNLLDKALKLVKNANAVTCAGTNLTLSLSPLRG